MALAAMLSALRAIILDFPSIPEEREARRVLYRAAFSALSDLEVDDLAKIPAEKIGTYTGTIYSAERGTLTSHFPFTFAYLSECWEAIYKKPFDGFQFVRALHQKYPWKANTTVVLAENFIRYLSNDLTQISSQFPILLEMARLEMTTLLVKREKDLAVPGSARQVLAWLSTLTVSELLTQPFQVSTAARFEHFNYDLIDAYQYFNNNEQSLPSTIRNNSTDAVVARDPENYTRWFKIPMRVRETLAVARYESCTIEMLALAFIEEREQESEAESFHQFLALLAELIERGVTIITVAAESAQAAVL